MAIPNTLRRLAEEVALSITGGAMHSEYQDFVQRAKPIIVGQINYMLRIEQLELRSIGENIASVDAVIASYTVLTADVSVDGVRSEFKLPVRPIRMPHGQGVWEVVLENANGRQKEVLPIPNGHLRNFLASHPTFDTNKKFDDSISETFFGWYTQKDGMTIQLNSSAFATDYTVHLKLLVADVSTIDEDDMLPIPADMVNEVMDYAINHFRGDKTPADETTNANDDA